MENLEAILDEFEILDPEERTEIEEALEVEAQDEALQAVEKVAHVAQSSLRRLQQVVKEKDDLILVLQDAVESAYKTALEQQHTDQSDLEQLHQMLLTQEDRSVQAVISALQEVIKQQPKSGNGLAGQLARLFDQYLHEVSSQHDHEIAVLHRSLAMWSRRCQELEDRLEQEKESSHSNHRPESDDRVVDWERAKTQLDESEALVESLKSQLSERDEKLRVYKDSLQELENMVEEEKERETNLSMEHERMCMETRDSLGQVSSVAQQLRQLKEVTHKFQEQGHANGLEVKALQEKVDRQKGLIQRLATQLSSLRKKSKTTLPKDDKDIQTFILENQKQTQICQECIQTLTAEILVLRKELQNEGKAFHDISTRSDHDVDLPHENSTQKVIPFTSVKECLTLVQTETLKKLEGHDKLLKKVELLQKRLENCRKELAYRDLDISRSGAANEQLRYELRKSKEVIHQLQEKFRKKVEKGRKKPSDCMRIKGLLDNIEKLEVENTLIKHETGVQNNRQIAKLERELRRARGFDMFVDGRQHEFAKATKIPDGNTWEKEKKDLEDIIIARDSLILELKFEVDQATWKLAQVEKRFNILFGALDCKKFELGAPFADSLLQNIFSSHPEDRSKSPVLNLLREKVLARRGCSRSGSREKELEGLVEELMKLVEKLSHENEMLKVTCEDAVKHMEKNKDLRKVVGDLQGQLVKGGKSDILQEKSQNQTETIAALRTQLVDLTNANAGLIKALKETEAMYAGMKERVHEQSKERRNLTLSKTGRRCSFSEETTISDQSKKIKSQADTISILEKQLALRAQAVNDLTMQLQRKDDELDLLHGKLLIKRSTEGSEDVHDNQSDVWGFAETNRKYCDVKRCRPEDYVDAQYIEENEWESLKEENRRLRTSLKAPHDPQIIVDMQNIKEQFQMMSEVCQRYEELLRIYSRQIGVPFTPLR